MVHHLQNLVFMISGLNSMDLTGGERVLKDTKELSGSVKSCVSDSSDQYF